MGPLIEITNVPIEIEMKVSHAKLEYTRVRRSWKFPEITAV